MALKVEAVFKLRTFDAQAITATPLEPVAKDTYGLKSEGLITTCAEENAPPVVTVTDERDAPTVAGPKFSTKLLEAVL